MAAVFLPGSALPGIHGTPDTAESDQTLNKKLDTPLLNLRH
jgi:hypothetical protein